MSWRVPILLVAAISILLGQVNADAGHQAALDLRAGDYTGARQILEAALKQSPRDARLWTLHGLTLVRLGHPTEALASFDRALQFAPTYYPALEGAAQIECQAGSESAVPTLRRMLAIRPDDIGVLRQLAFLLMKQKRAAEALPLFKRLAALEPSDDKAILDLAAVQFLTADYAGVVSTLTPLASKQPPNVEALDLLAEAYSLTSDTDKALSILRSAIAASPDSIQSYLDFANICLSHGLFQAGVETLNSGLVRVPDSAALYVARGVLYSELAQYDKGEADFNRAEQIDPNVEGAPLAKGLAELQHNDLAQAESTVRERLHQQPRDAFSHYLLAEVLTRKGATDEALSAARKAVELKPDFALARDLLGRLYLQQGDVAEAIEQSRFALRYSPTDQKALYHLILALRRGNRTDEVPALLKQLVALREQTGKQQAAQHNYALLEQSQP